MRYLRKNTAVIITVGPFYDKTDGISIETGLTITNERITLVADTDDGSAPTNILDNITGAASATANDLNYITNNDAGLMQMELAQADVNRNGRLFLTITDAANHVPVFHEFMILPAVVYDALILGTDNLDVSVADLAANSITAAAINADAIGASELAADAVAEIADAVMDEVINTGHSTANSLGKIVYDNLNAPVATVDTVVDAIKAKTDNLPAAPADDTSIDTQLGTIAGYLDTEVAAILAAVDTEVAAILADTNELQTDLVNGGRLDLLVDAIKAKTDLVPASPAAVGSAMTLADDAITAGKFDESTAFPLKSADTGSTAVARTGADSDTLETLSDEVAAIDAAMADVTDITTPLATVDTVVDAIKVVTDNVAGMYETDGAVKRYTTNALEQAPAGGTGLDAAGVRAAVGLASANLDTQLTAIDDAVDTEVAAIKTVVDNIHDTDLPAVKTETAAIKAKTDNLPAAPADDTSIDTQLGTIAGYLDTEVAATLAAVDTEVAAIKAKTDNLPASPAAVGSEMVLSAAYDHAKDDVLTPLAVVDGVADAIKLKTDNLPADPADQSAVEAAITAAAGPTAAAIADAVLDEAGAGHTGLIPTNLDAKVSNVLTPAGPGAIEWVYNLLDDVSNPIDNAAVWVSTDLAGTSVIASGYTDAHGNVTFYLDAGTVYVWCQKSGYDFTNPDTEVVS